MPEKYTVVRSRFPGPKAARHERSYITLTWLPSCDLEPYSTVTNVDEVRNHNSVEEYASNSHWIDGKLGLPLPTLPMNYCHHLVSRLELPERGSISLKRYTSSETDYSRSPGECGPLQFVKSTVHKDESILCAFGPSIWLGLMGSGNYPLTTDPYLPIGTSGFSTKLAELDGMALDAMVPQLDDGFSLPVFLFEILEVKSLVVNALKLISGLPSAVLRLLSKPLAELSDHWLEAVFGWLPLVRDIKTIVGKLIGMRDSITAYLKGANKVKTLHFKKGLSPYTFRPESWFNPTGSVVIDTHVNPYQNFADIFEELSFDYICNDSVDDLDYFATARLEYRIPEVESLLTRIWATFDLWGVNLSPSDVWEVIPFSFVVDWFLGVGPMIAKLDQTNLNVQVIIYDFCRSLKHRYTRQVQLTEVHLINHLGDEDSAGWTSPALELATWVVDSYYRLPGVPAPTESQMAGWHLPRGMTLITAPALGYSQLNKRLLRLLRRR